MEEKQLEQVVKDEERLRELKRQNRQKRRQNVQRSQSSEQEVTRTIQKGTIRDYERSQDTGTYTLRIETKHDQVDVIIPMATEYTLDEELVTLLEWKDIDDGRVGDLLDEQVYVNTEENELVLPSTMSPIANMATHFNARTQRYMPTELQYMLMVMMSLITSLFFLPVLPQVLGQHPSALEITIVAVMFITVQFIVMPAIITLLLKPTKVIHNKAKTIWENKYRKI